MSSSPTRSIATGGGAAVAASTSQKWNGTIAALMRNPATMSAKAVTTSWSAGFAARRSPMTARLSAPVRAYRRAMPISTKNAPMLLTIAKCSAPRSARMSPVLIAMSAMVQTLISSKNTKRLNTSPVRQNPAAAARRTRTSAWARAPNCSAGAATSTTALTRRPANSTPRAPNWSTEKETPSATPCRGVQPPNQ